MTHWAWIAVATPLVLGACASKPSPRPTPELVRPAVAPAEPRPDASQAAGAKPRLPHYACEQGPAFDVRFGDGSADIVFASGETVTLMRDAGGTSPQHTVYSSTRIKVEFGLDPDARGAQLKIAEPALSAHCVRE
jgi:hypothetical protein